MRSFEKTKEEINSLVDEGFDLLKAINADDSGKPTNLGLFIAKYEPWYTKALVVVKQLLPSRLEDFTVLYRQKQRKEINNSTYTISDALKATVANYGNCKPSTAAYSMASQVKILESCLDVFDSRIHALQTDLQADIFDSELDSAKYLIKRGFIRAAGAICGVVIEKHFSVVCENRNIILKKKHPTISEYNEALKNNAYDMIEWRRIQRLGDIRNLCDHSKDREPTKDEVEELVSGTERVIKTIF